MECFLSDIRLTIDGIDFAQEHFLKFVFPFSARKVIDSYRFVFGEKVQKIDDKDYSCKLINKIISSKDNLFYVDYANGLKSLWDINKHSFFYSANYYSNLRHWLVDTIIDPLSISLVPNRKVILHGALWSNNNNGIIIVGNSGDGKSTLSYLMRNHLRIISDDILIVSFENDGIYAEPINTGFGISRGLKDVDIFRSDNILVSTDKKIYVRSLYSNGSTTMNYSRKIPVKKIYLLQKMQSLYTNITIPSRSESLLQFLNLQTNIKHPFLKDKYSLVKDLLENCSIRFVKYADECQVEVLLKNIVGEST